MKKNGLLVFLVSIWIILAVIFGIYDLDISKLIVHQNSSSAKFLENYGMIPGLSIILSGIYIYYSFIKTKSDIWSYIQKVVFYLVGSGLIFYLFEIVIGDSVTSNLVVFLVRPTSAGVCVPVPAFVVPVFRWNSSGASSLIRFQSGSPVLVNKS